MIPVMTLLEYLRALVYVLRLAFQSAPLRSVFAFVHSIFAGLSAPLVVWSIQNIVHVAQTLPRSEIIIEIPPWAGLFVIASLISASEIALGNYLSQYVADQMEGAAQRQVLKQATSVPLEYIETPLYFQKLDMGKDALVRFRSVLSELGAFIVAMSSVAGLLFLFFTAHWVLALALAATVLLRMVVGSYTEVRMERIHYASSPKRREVEYWSSLLSGRESAAEVRLFGLADFLIARWKNLYREYVDSVARGRKEALKVWSVSLVVQEIVHLGGVFSLLFFALNGRIGLGALVAFIYGLERLRRSAETFTWTGAQIIETLAYVANLRDFLILPGEREGSAKESGVSTISTQLSTVEVRFEGVTFCYPGSSSPAIVDVNLTLRANESVALVGPNGAGKSTLVRLLLGLYLPTKGRITVNGIDFREIPTEEWRRRVAAVFQDFARYPTSIAENIAYGDTQLVSSLGIESLADHPRVHRAARKARVDSFVQQLPSGYRTLLGKEFDGAVDLSGGQWQRLALARVFLRDARIIVLDEPTASLDPKAEVEIYRQFADAAKDRTAIFVSHRLGSARLADRIIVLDRGRVVEEGTHESLLNSSGPYSRMFRMQAAWYVETTGDGETV